MLYDNSSPTTRVHTWLGEQTKTGRLDDLLVGLQNNDPARKPLHNDGKTLEQQYDPENCDLILWFIIGKQP